MLVVRQRDSVEAAFVELVFVEAENSTGFHAPQEAERILAESIDYARQGPLALRGVDVPGLKTADLVKPRPTRAPPPR